jgi:BRCT domain type II-containing protein
MFETPGLDGAIEGQLKGTRFVVKSVFPQICGGFGLTIGREKLQAMIESFDSKVTTLLSGKTDYVIDGDEPGEKRSKEARSKRKPIINGATLHKILTGERYSACHREDLRSLKDSVEHFSDID